MKKTETKKIQKAALCFTEASSYAKVDSFVDGEKKKLLMVGYSGGIIKNHFYWGDLAIDVEGMSLSSNNIPILHDHDTDQKIGFGKFIVNSQHQIVPEDATFVDTEAAREFIKLSGEGFPYQASIRANPTQIIRLEENEEAEVNGFTMKGPGTVWRKSVLKECSVTTFGADSNTKSVAMSENEDVEMEVEQKQIKNEEVVIMKLDEFKAAHPDLFAEVVLLGKTEASVAFAEVQAKLEAQINALTAEKQSLSSLNEQTESRLLKLEKVLAIGKEEGIKARAEVVFAEVIGKHEIPARLHSKIRKQINHDSFVADEKLNETAFAEAIETELKDWVSVEGEENTSILGLSFPKAGIETSTDGMVDRMLKHVGQTLKH